MGHAMHGISVTKQEAAVGGVAEQVNCKFMLGDFKTFGSFLAQQLSRSDDDQVAASAA